MFFFNFTVIAQLSRDNEQQQHLSLPSQTTSSTTCSLDKKARTHRGFFRSLLCCLGKNRHNASRKSSKTSSSIQGDHHHTGIGGQHGSPPRSRSPLFLLPPVKLQDMHKKCLVIDLDETLVHSSFKPINNADFVVPVEIDGAVHQVYVLKRPYVDEFLQKMGELYECVLFTASLAKV